MSKLKTIAWLATLHLAVALIQTVQSFNCRLYHVRNAHVPFSSVSELSESRAANVIAWGKEPLDATERNVTILSRGPNHIVALKPPAVVCHHSGWTGSRAKAKRGEEPEIPMLQRGK